MQGPTKQSVALTTLVTGVQQTRGLNGNNARNLSESFKWFNWGHKDFRLNLDVTSGSINVYLNFISEETYQTNAHTALPRNANNSRWTVSLNSTWSVPLRVTKDEVGNIGSGLFCYFCWYFITVEANSTGAISYRIAVNEMPDVGEEVAILNVN